MSTDTASNGINPTNTNNEKKHWWITTQLARLLNYLSLTRIIGRIIPKRLSDWAKNVLGPDSPSTATSSEKDQSQNGQETPTPEVKIEKSNELESEIEVKDEAVSKNAEVQINSAPAQEKKSVGTDLSWSELEGKLKAEFTSQKEAKNFQSELDKLKDKLTKIVAEKGQLLTLIGELRKLVGETESLKKEFSKERERLEGGIKNLKEEKKLFANYFAMQAQQLGALQVENEELKSIIEELSKSYRELAEVAEKREKEFLAKLSEQFGRIPGLIGKVIICTRGFADKIKKLEKEAQAKDQEISELKRVNEVLDEAKKAVEVNNTEQQQTISEKDQKIRDLEERNRSLTDNKDINEAVKQENERLKERVTELEEKSRKQQEEINLLQKKSKHVDLLNNKCETLRGENKGLEKSLQQVQTELDQVRRENKELKEQVSTANNEISGLQLQLEDLTAQLKGLRIKLQEEEKKNEDLFVNFNNSTEQNSSLKQELERSNSDLTSEKARAQLLQGEKSQHEAQLTDLRNKLEAAEKDKKKLGEQITELQEQVKTLEKSNSQKWKENAQERNQELLAKDEELKRVQTDLSQKNRDLQAELNSEKAEVNRQKDIVSKRDTDIQELQGAKEQSDKDLQEANRALDEQKGLVEQLQSKQKLQPSKEKLSEQTEQSKDPKPQEQEQAKVPEQDAVSRVSIKSKSGSTKSTLSKIWNLPNRLLSFQTLKDFLTDKNIELKKSFPEFEGKSFCHTAVKETIMSLSNENGGKFQSDKLLELLESKLKELAKQIIKERVTKVGVNKKNYDDGKHINAALQRVNNDNSKIDSTVERDLQSQLLLSIKECVGKLDYNKKDVERYTLSIIDKFKQRKVGKNDLGELLKDIVVEELVEARMNFFSSEVEELGLVSSIRDKFLSPDQKMCDTISEESNEYQLNSKIMDKYKLRSQTDNTSVSSVQNQKRGGGGFLGNAFSRTQDMLNGEADKLANQKKEGSQHR